MKSCAMGQSFVIGLLLSCGLASSIHSADKPRFVGRTSCATATCHGGITSNGPAWHSSSNVFESSDPHSRAGEVLLNELSMRIVSALEPAASSSEEIFLHTLQARCVSCHAPETLPAPGEPVVAAKLNEVRARLVAGVSCEACHGPASVWENEHTRVDWEKSERFTLATGMLDTESLLARTDNCTRCHVGSRTADNHIRDMNHDMIAAGHPPLYFDMFRYQARLPSHWSTDVESLASTPPKRLPKTVEAMQARVLLAAMRLSQERRAQSAHSPQPELAEFDCAACHHTLQLDSPRQRRGSTGSALWHPWYTASQQLERPRDQLRLDQPDIELLLHSLEAPTRQRSVSLMQTPDTDLFAHLESLLTTALPDSRADYCGAVIWLDQLELAGRAVAMQKGGELPQQFDKLTLLFRDRVLGQRQAIPSTLEVLMPREWEQRDIETLRKELSLCITPDERRGPQ